MQGEFSLHHFSTSDCINTSRNDRVPLITLEKKKYSKSEKVFVFKEMIFYTATDPWQPIQQDTNSTVVWLMRFDEEGVLLQGVGGKPSALCIFIPRLPFRVLPQSMWQFVVPAVLHLWLTALEKRQEFFINLGDLCSGFGECSLRNSEDVSRTHLVNKTKNNL